jgi:hypothetical protein
VVGSFFIVFDITHHPSLPVFCLRFSPSLLFEYNAIH